MGWRMINLLPVPNGLKCRNTGLTRGNRVVRFELKTRKNMFCLVSKSSVLRVLTFAELRSRREAALLFPRVVMASKTGRLSLFPSLMIILNTKSHPNNTKPDQLLIFEVIAGFPRPYHNTGLITRRSQERTKDLYDYCVHLEADQKNSRFS